MPAVSKVGVGGGRGTRSLSERAALRATPLEQPTHSAPNKCGVINVSWMETVSAVKTHSTEFTQRTVHEGTSHPKVSAEAILEGVGPFWVSSQRLNMELDYGSVERHFKAPSKFSVLRQKVLLKLQRLNHLLPQCFREIDGDLLIKQQQGAIHYSAPKILLRTSLIHLYKHQLKGKDLKIKKQSHIWRRGQMTSSSFDEIAKAKQPRMSPRGKNIWSWKETDFLG